MTRTDSRMTSHGPSRDSSRPGPSQPLCPRSPCGTRTGRQSQRRRPPPALLAAPAPARPHRSEPPTPASGVRRIGLTAAGKFWYVLGCIAFGGAYLAKGPAKKAMADFGLAELTAAQTFLDVPVCSGF